MIGKFARSKNMRRLLIVGFLLACALAAKAWHDTMRDPLFRELKLESDDLQPDADPVKVALLADIHVAGPDMLPSRLAKIVELVNASDPDIIMIAGDLVSEKRTATKTYTPKEIVEPLGELEARYGVALVPGNHDHWYDWPGLSQELAKLDQITVLANSAEQFGPLAIGGVDDDFTGRADLKATMRAMEPLSGPRVILTHSPDIFPSVPVDVDLVLAGHTHCGQIAFPWGGAPATMSEFGDKYSCGIVEQHGKTLITSAGIGTSLLPIRLFTQPEIWLIEIQPPQL